MFSSFLTTVSSFQPRVHRYEFSLSLHAVQIVVVKWNDIKDVLYKHDEVSKNTHATFV
jgi:hypothetical protein